MRFPDRAIDDHVPPAIRRDVAREVGKLKATGATHILVQIPIEDFASTMGKVCRGALTPFRPTLCGEPAAAWEQTFVGVMGRPDQHQLRPVIYGADGREHEVAQIDDNQLVPAAPARE